MFDSVKANTCCQYFDGLTPSDRIMINSQETIMLGISLFMSVVGSIFFSIWSMFLQMKGRFTGYVVLTLSTALISQFCLTKSIVKYGDSCI